jgi:hypothetical protein
LDQTGKNHMLREMVSRVAAEVTLLARAFRVVDGCAFLLWVGKKSSRWKSGLGVIEGAHDGLSIFDLVAVSTKLSHDTVRITVMQAAKA